MAANRCLDTNDGKINFRNYKSVLNGLLNLFKLPSTSSQTMPTPLILASKASRPGLSPTTMAARVIKRQSEAGLPVGNLPSGKTSGAEIMERIRMEEIVNALTSEAIISVATQPGTAGTGTGGNAGGPIVTSVQQVGIGEGAAVMS
jgi:hypothetical protein